jgi:hypothetical protein
VDRRLIDRGSPLLLAAAAACSGPHHLELIAAALPPEVEWVAVVGVDPAGDLAGASGLFPILDRRGLGFAALDGAASIEVLGFSSAELRTTGATLTESALRTSPLSSPLADEPLLPPARWRARFDLEGRPSGQSASRPLTAAWIPRCPRRVAEGTVVMSCAFSGCEAQVAQTGCRLQIDARSCARGVLQGTVEAAGPVTFAPSEALGACAEVPPQAQESLALECRSDETLTCAIEVRTGRVPPPLIHTPLRLAEVPPFVDGLDSRPTRGYLTGLAIAGDRVVVARELTGPRGWDSCPPEQRGVFELIEVADATSAGTTTAPPCVADLAAGPSGTVVALSGGAAPSVVRVDREGRVTAAASLEDPARNPGQLPVRLFATQTRLLVLFTEPQEGPVTSTILELDPRSLAPLRSVAVSERVLVMGRDLDGEVTFITDVVDVLYALIGDQPARQRPLWSLCSSGIRMRPTAVVAHPATQRLVITADINDAQPVFSLDPLARCRPAVFPWFDADATSAIAWPAAPELLLIGLTTQARASAALFDPATSRFVSAELELGHGVPSAPAIDGAGKVWLMLPWIADVVRVEPRL